MDEYIKKADVVKLCENYSEYCFDNCDFLGASDFERLQKDIEQLPTADVVEVKHGYWKRVRWVKCDDPDGGYWIVRCNQCSIPHFKKYNYCPSCGAKMDVSKMEITTERKDT